MNYISIQQIHKKKYIYLSVLAILVVDDFAAWGADGTYRRKRRKVPDVRTQHTVHELLRRRTNHMTLLLDALQILNDILDNVFAL